MRPSLTLALTIALASCGTTSTTPDASTTAPTPEDGIRAAAAARMTQELGCRGLKPADVELVRTTKRGDDLVGETLVSGCGELKRYTIVCAAGSCGVDATAAAAGDEGGDPMAIVADAAVARVKADTGCAEATLSKIREPSDATEGGVRVRRGVVKVKGCGDIWNYATECRDKACTSENADRAPSKADDDLTVPDLGDLDLKNVDDGL